MFPGYGSADHADLIGAVRAHCRHRCANIGRSGVSRSSGTSVLRFLRPLAQRDISKDSRDSLVHENIIYRVIEIQHIQQALLRMMRLYEQIPVRAAGIGFHHLFPVLLFDHKRVQDPHLQEGFLQPAAPFGIPGQFPPELHDLVELLIGNPFLPQSFPVLTHGAAPGRLRLAGALPLCKLLLDLPMSIFQIPEFILSATDFSADLSFSPDPQIRRSLTHPGKI